MKFSTWQLVLIVGVLLILMHAQNTGVAGANGTYVPNIYSGQ